MKKSFCLNAEPLKLIVNCFTGYSFDELNEWLKKNEYSVIKEELREGTAIFFEQSMDNVRFYGFCIHNFSLDREGVGDLVHELHHIVEIQCEYKGIDDRETKAYLMEYYFKEFLKKFNFK